MRKIICIITALCISAALLSCGADVKHKIEVEEKQNNIILSCPKSARPGEIVSVETCSVCDGEVKITINGEDTGKFISEGEYEFVMPDCDVKLYAKISTDGYSA